MLSKTKKLIGSLVMAFALVGMLVLPITSNAAEYTNNNTGHTLTVLDNVNFNIAESNLYAGTNFRELNNANLSSDYCRTTHWVYNSLEAAREDNLNNAIKSYDNAVVEEGKDYYINISVLACDNTGDTAIISSDYQFGTNTTQFTCTNGEVVEVNLNSPHTQSGYIGLTDTTSGSGHVIVKITGKANPNATQSTEEVVTPTETPVVDTPAVEAAPVEAVAEPAPTEEIPAPAETVKATDSAPKTGDTMPLIPIALIEFGTVIGGAVILTKRFC